MKRLATVLAVLLMLLFSTVQPSAQDARNVEGSLPKDVHPDSRSRLPLVERDSLDEARKKAYDNLVANSAGVQQGALLLLLHGFSGGVAQAQTPVGLPLIQLATLITTRELDQPYAFTLHELQALAVGLDPAVIAIIRDRKGVEKLGPKEAAMNQLGREMIRNHRVSSATYSKALSLFGQRNLMDVIGVLAQFASTSATLTAFNQQIPPGWYMKLPLPFKPPDDIHADSKSRLPLNTDPPPTPLPTGFQGVLYGRELAPTGTGPIYVGRHGGGLKSLLASAGRRTVDLAILVSAREHDSPYDWTMNEIEAIKNGLEPAVIDIVRTRKPVANLAEKDASLIELGRELFQKHYVTSQTYSRALKAFGERDLVDLVSVMGRHATEAAILAAFDQHLPAGQKPLLPLP